MWTVVEVPGVGRITACARTADSSRWTNCPCAAPKYGRDHNATNDSLGIPSTARISAAALIDAGVHVTAIASRDRERSEVFASRYGIHRVHDSYQELIDDPEAQAQLARFRPRLCGPAYTR